MLDLRNVSVSHSTLRTVDLLRSFSAFIREYANNDGQHDALITEAILLSRIDEESLTESLVLQQEESVESLFGILDSISPSGYYFGSHPGNGSDFGFWECESWLTEDSE